MSTHNMVTIEQRGSRVEIPVDISMYDKAEAAQMSVEAYINRTYPTASNEAPAFKQLMAATGLIMASDHRKGIQSPTLADVLTGACMADGLGPANTSQATPMSRILFPVAILSAIEDKLPRDLTTAANAFNSMVAHTEAVPNNHFTRVVTNYDKPEAARNGATAQLARPQNMMTLTAVERPGVIPVQSLGITWSDQVAQGTSLDFIALSVARQIAVQRDYDAQEATLALINGNTAADQGALPAKYRKKASDYDAASVGKLTHNAWIAWLFDGGNFRSIDYVITDFKGALAIENREGRPVVVGDNNTSPRINTEMVAINPLIPANVKVFVTRHPDWPAGTILGFQRSYAIQRVISLGANYNAVQQNVINRSNTMRWDSGSIAYRLYDESYSLLDYN